MKYNWTTEFDTANNLMTHTFSDRLKIITNIKTGEVKGLKDGSVMYTQTAGSIESYTQLLLNTAKDAERLSQFNN